MEGHCGNSEELAVAAVNSVQTGRSANSDAPDVATANSDEPVEATPPSLANVEVSGRMRHPEEPTRDAEDCEELLLGERLVEARLVDEA